VTAEVRDALQGDERFAFKPVRPRRLKGIGLTALWVARRHRDQPTRALPAAVLERMRVRRQE
jgi:hypothetical protein